MQSKYNKLIKTNDILNNSKHFYSHYRGQSTAVTQAVNKTSAEISFTCLFIVLLEYLKQTFFETQMLLCISNRGVRK